MAQVLRMPDEATLPDGPRRKFVVELFMYYRDAGRPALRIITDGIAEKFDAFTASRETIRKMLRGTTVPVNWEVVEGVLTVLCARADVDPDSPRWPEEFDADEVTHRQNLRNLWNDALDTPPLDTPPVQRSSDPWDDPWSTGSSGPAERPDAWTYSDEPPF